MSGDVYNHMKLCGEVKRTLDLDKKECEDLDRIQAYVDRKEDTLDRRRLKTLLHFLGRFSSMKRMSEKRRG